MEEFVGEGEIEAEPRRDARVADAALGGSDDAAGRPLIVGSRILIACTCDTKSQNRKLRCSLPYSLEEGGP